MTFSHQNIQQLGTIGSYTLVRKLGEGGFAQVYLGQHHHLGSLAAIKLLRVFARASRSALTLQSPYADELGL